MGALPGPRIAGQAGFAQGVPRPDAHAQEIASLPTGAGTARIYVADVYGQDPAGGIALAIGRALGWVAGQHVPVVSPGLVGPANPLAGARYRGAAGARGDRDSGGGQRWRRRAACLSGLLWRASKA